MTCREIDESVKLLSHELRDLIESKEQWKLMVETTEGLIPNAGKFVEMRSLLFAEYSSRTLRKRLRIITGLLLLLIFMSLLFGSLALAPDPFWYVFLTEMFSGDVLRRSEPNYPEMSLWITACIYLGNVFFLTLWFGLETHSVHLHNTDSFDE
jgi:Na+-transporting NADH:ubiquinone oxidoreductase subunit NqrB